MSIRDEVRASAAAHRDLGPGYDTAVAEGLVERIGEEIDRRVDARLSASGPPAPPRPRLRRSRCPGGSGWAGVAGPRLDGLAIGATVAVLHPGDTGPGQRRPSVLVALIWIVIGVINVAYARYRQLSGRLFVAIPGTLYRALMGSDHEAEIRASVGAHDDLGSGYDDAVAEGLVERIGAEIDKRIDARLGHRFLGTGAWVPGAGGAGRRPARGPCPAGAAGAPAAAPAGPAGYQGYIRGTRVTWGPCCRPDTSGTAPVGRLRSDSATWRRPSSRSGPWPSASRPRRSWRTRQLGGQAFMVLLIWVAIAIVNVAYARRP